MNRKKIKDYCRNNLPLLFKLFYALKYAFTKKQYCPFCKKEVPLVSGGKPLPRKHAKCVFCNSLERHRFLYYVYQVEILAQQKNLKLLHFAPEESLSKLFINAKNIDCVFGDIFPEGYKYVPDCKKIDALNICYPEKTFDIIIANHLIEHIDEARFMSELERVLKDDGKVFLSAPVYWDLPQTLQDAQYNTAQLRNKYYGHKDHLRKYGADIVERFSKYFDVCLVRPEAILPFSDKVNSNCFILTKKTHK